MTPTDDTPSDDPTSDADFDAQFDQEFAGGQTCDASSLKRGSLVHEATVDRSGPSPVVTAVKLVRALADRDHALDRRAGRARRSRPAPSPPADRSRRASRSFGSVIIFMYWQTAASVGGQEVTSGAASRSGCSIPVSVATIAVAPGAALRA